MPLYPFTCRGCATPFEALVPRPTENPAAECPACGGTDVERGFGVPARPTTGPAARELPATNCAGTGPPCGAAWCGRRPAAG